MRIGNFRQRYVQKTRQLQKNDATRFQKIKDSVREQNWRQKWRSMKSSWQWTTIHFHFELLWTVVKCDCKWQSPSLLAYHDGYTLLLWCCCSTLTCTCTQRQIHEYRETQRLDYTHIKPLIRSIYSAHSYAHKDTRLLQNLFQTVQFSKMLVGIFLPLKFF